MAGAEIIGAAIGVLLLILVGYLMIGSALTTAEVVASAQKDITIQGEARLQTAINISSVSFGTPTTLILKNTGQEPISDFTHMDVVLFYGVNSPQKYSYDSGGTVDTWKHDPISGTMNPGTLEPGEQMLIIINNLASGPSYVQVICANGVYAYGS